MKEQRILKNNFLMKVTQLEKVEDENGKQNLKVTDSKWVKCNAKDFEESVYFDRAAGIEHKVQVVTQAPEKFQFNTVYISADGKQAYTYILKEDEDETVCSN